MNATITFKMANIPHPWNDKSRAQGIKAWCLMKVVTPEIGMASLEEPIAIFNFNSEAELFMSHIFATGLDGKLVTIDGEMKEMLEYIRARKQ